MVSSKYRTYTGKGEGAPGEEILDNKKGRQIKNCLQSRKTAPQAKNFLVNVRF
jgi:hypothetical protein